MRGGLVPVGTVLLARRPGLADPAARADHAAAFRRWNVRQTMADVGAMKAAVYADYLGNRWWAFMDARLDDAVFASVEPFWCRRHGPSYRDPYESP
ncbi:MAG: hypothetical protein JWO31_1533 [Phycisphaerales bacterium]|nr:hypothetical protein [Phycisphaerales bacterium]